ncbi:hypothetical protein ACR30L_12755 [Psychromonas sp. PT13]|uniref:hypothetical protein n=1 Tax=Psychromonas sp. PT13 TaxID=3439547 RepID=UPI003EB725EC
MHKKHFVLGGDLKKSLTEGYQLDFKSLIKDAITITKKHYLSLVTASLFTVILLAGCYHLTFGGAANLSSNGQMLGNYLIALLVAPPLLTGLQMMGIHHSIGLKTKSIDLFNYFRIILKLSTATLMISVINNVISLLLTQTLGQMGFVVSIVVLLYLNMAFTFVYPLISEKKIKPQAALILSFKLVHKNILQFTLMFMILGLLFFIALSPYGLGLFLFIPFYFNLMGIIYRKLCGVGVVATTIDEGSNGSSGRSQHTGSSNGQFDA